MKLKNLSVKIKILKLLRNNKINQIYKRFEKSLNINENFLVAVSGGPDSLTLALLSKIYSIKNKLSPKYFIVDHKLRPNSTNEAKNVKKVLKKAFINAEILTWKGKKPIKNVQSLARKNRYKLLFQQSDKFKIKNILLGHHQDDLLENFFIRMVRGSGLKGLISLDKKNEFGNKKLLRPLLDQKKKDLIFICNYVFNFYVEDPSNKNEKYQRVKVRKLIEELQKNGLDKKKFFKTINNLKYSNDVVNFYVQKNLKDNVFFSSKKNSFILNKEFFENSYEVIFRAFSDLIKLLGNKDYPSRGKKIDKIIIDLQNNIVKKATLGGCIIEKVNQSVIISKEY